MADLDFVGFHLPPPPPNFEVYPYPCGTPKFQIVFVIKDARGVEMITRSHFLLLEKKS